MKWSLKRFLSLVYFRDNIETRVNACEFLLKHGADVNYCNSFGNSILQIALSGMGGHNKLDVEFQ